MSHGLDTLHRAWQNFMSTRDVFTRWRQAMHAENLQFFKDHQDELVEKFAGKTLLLKDQAVVSAHDDALDAYLAGQRQFAPGQFSIQPCEPGPGAYTVLVSSLDLSP